MSEPKKVIVISGRQLLIAVVTVLLSVLAMVGINLVYTNYVDTNSNQVWCDIINGLDSRYSKLPQNADKDAKEFARQIADVKRKYHC